MQIEKVEKDDCKYYSILILGHCMETFIIALIIGNVLSSS